MAARFAVNITGSVTWDGSNTAIWSATSGGGSGAAVPVAGDTVTFDASSGSGTCVVNTNVSIASLTTSAFTGTLDMATNSNTFTFSTSFVNTGTATRTITFGAGVVTIGGNNATVWSCADLTNCTFTPPTNPVLFNYSGATGTRTISNGSTAGGSETTAISVSITAGTDIITFANSATNALKSLDFTGFSGTITGTSYFIYRNLTLSSMMTITAGAQIWTFAATSGTQVITTNGLITDRGITLSGTGTYSFVDGWAGSTRAFIYNSGTIQDNGQTFTFGTLTSATATARNWLLSGTWNFQNSGATVFNFGNATNFTLTQTGTINFTYSGSVGTRTITTSTTANGFVETNALSLNITGGSDVIAISTNRVLKTLDFTGFSGTWTPSSMTYYGGLILSNAMTIGSSAAGFTFSATSGTFNISTNSNATYGTGTSITIINAPGGTYQWGSTFTSLGQITFTAGTLNFNGFDATCTIFSTSNSNTRVLNMGNGRTLTLTGTGIVFNSSNSTGLTISADTSVIKINDSSATEKEIATDALTFNNIYFTGGGTGDLFIRPTPGAITINNFKVDPAMIVKFFAGSTTNITSWTVSGTAGNLITLQSTVSGTKWNLVCSSGSIVSDYVSLQDSAASGGAKFYAGLNSTNVSNNTGWAFGTPLTIKGISTITGIRTLTF